jgi:hypothetical protein
MAIKYNEGDHPAAGARREHQRHSHLGDHRGGFHCHAQVVRLHPPLASIGGGFRLTMEK